MTPQLLVLAGSTRRDSFNRRLARLAARAAREAGAAVTEVDLADYPLPLFDQDLEAESGLPDAARRLQDLFMSHDGLLIAAPEYNSSVTPLLKNAIDWISRPGGDYPGGAAFAGKVAGLVSASPGALGGLRGVMALRWILLNLGVLVIPRHVSVPSAASAFDDEGNLVDEGRRRALGALARSVVVHAQAEREERAR